MTQRNMLFIFKQGASYPKTRQIHEFCNQADIGFFIYEEGERSIDLLDTEEMLGVTKPMALFSFGVPFHLNSSLLKRAMRKYSMIYLACPYAHPDEDVREQRVLNAVRAAAVLTEAGNLVYCPIAGNHMVQQQLARLEKSSGSHEFWMKHSLHMLKNASEMVVLCEDGWEESAGVREELDFCAAEEKRVRYVKLRAVQSRDRTGLHNDWTLDEIIGMDEQGLTNEIELDMQGKIGSIAETSSDLTHGLSMSEALRLQSQMHNADYHAIGKDGSETPLFILAPDRHPPPDDLYRLVQEVRRWQAYNFAPSGGNVSLKGLVEEFGELAESLQMVGLLTERETKLILKIQSCLGKIAHGVIKSEQGIRGNEDHEATVADGVGDMAIYLIDFCNQRNLDFCSVLFGTWAEVRTRDWVRFPGNGRTE